MDLGRLSIKDDISAVANKMALSLAALDKRANDLFVESGGNFKDFQKGLKAAGVSTIDASLMTKKYQKALVEARKEALGLSDTAQKAAKDIAKEQAKAAKEYEKQQRAQIKLEKERQRELERTKAAQEKAAKSTTWGQMKGAFATAVSPKQMAIGAARSMGAGLIGLPLNALSASFDVVSGIGERIFEVGRDLVGAVVDAAQFRQNAITGLEYMLGTRKEAEQIFADAQKLAQETPLDTDKVISGIKQLVTAGFSGKDSMLLFKSVADQASKFADDAGMQDKVIAAFSRVKGRGVASGEDLESMRVAGFRSEGIIQALLDNPNLSPLFKKVKVAGIAGGKPKFVDRSKADQESILKQVKEVLGEGKIGSTTFLNAVLASAEKGKPDIGEFAKKMGKVSLTGTISNFKSAFGDLLKSTNLESWKGIEAFQKFLTRITEMMQGDVGRGLLKTIENIINALLGGLDRITDSNIEGFVKKIASLGESAVDVIKDAWGWLDRLLNQGDIGDSMADILIDVAKYIGAGIWEGVKNAGSIIKDRDVEKRLSFQKKHGITSEYAEAKAAELGISAKQFIQTFDAARKAFLAAGGTVDFSAVHEGKVGEHGVRTAGFSAQDAIFAAISKRSEFADQFAKTPAPLDIPKLASGGIVTSPTLAWVGEAGPEAVVPLRTMAGASEASVSRFSGGAESVGGGAGRVGMGSVGSLSVQVNVGSVAGGDPSAVGNAIADITVERVMMALLERKAAEA